MSTPAMSSAKKTEQKYASCSHVSIFLLSFFHRAKPVSETKRQRSRTPLRTPPPPLRCASEPAVRDAPASPTPAMRQRALPPRCASEPYPRDASASPTPAARQRPTPPSLLPKKQPPRQSIPAQQLPPLIQSQLSQLHLYGPTGASTSPDGISGPSGCPGSGMGSAGGAVTPGPPSGP